ncbi:MAG: hypothetical protein PHC34_10725 [Candidatus Gastranaerophilales bacterium]|nr:hypothetical protein [Candidatus Gastranaerophilales bacterium]
MTQEWPNIDIFENFKNTDEVIQSMVEIVMDNPDTFIEHYKMFIYSALKNLEYYINNPLDDFVNWENPIIDLHYDVSIKDNMEPIFLEIDENDIKNTNVFNKKLTNSFSNFMNIFLLESLCGGTKILLENDNYSYLTKSQDINSKIANITNKDEKVSKIIELTHYKSDILFKIDDFMEKTLIQKITGKFMIEFTPLIIDSAEHTGYYSIIVSLLFDQDLQKLSFEDKNSLLEELLESIKEDFSVLDNEYIKIPEGFIGMGFKGKLFIEKSLNPNFIGNDTLQICSNNLYIENQKPQRKLIINDSLTILNDEEKRLIDLYAKDGIENYSKIADLMHCSLQTVKNIAQRIRLKLGANTMAQATYLYYKQDFN